MKTNKLMTRLLSSALVALGFTACDNETTDDVYPLEYGSGKPHRKHPGHYPECVGQHP